MGSGFPCQLSWVQLTAISFQASKWASSSRRELAKTTEMLGIVLEAAMAEATPSRDTSRLWQGLCGRKSPEMSHWLYTPSKIKMLMLNLKKNPNWKTKNHLIFKPSRHCVPNVNFPLAKKRWEFLLVGNSSTEGLKVDQRPKTHSRCVSIQPPVIHSKLKTNKISPKLSLKKRKSYMILWGPRNWAPTSCFEKKHRIFFCTKKCVQKLAFFWSMSKVTTAPKPFAFCDVSNDLFHSFSKLQMLLISSNITSSV